MDWLDSILYYIIRSIMQVVHMVVAPGSFLSPLPMLIAGGIGAVALFFQMRKLFGRVSVRRLARRVLTLKIWNHPSARRDYAMVFLNEGPMFFLTVGLISEAQVIATSHTLFGVREAVATEPSWVLLAAFTLFSAMAWDFFASFMHLLKHRVPILWELHKVHHSAEVLTPFTAFRRHPIEIIVSQTLTAAGVGLVTVVWAFFLPVPVDVMTIFGLNAVIYVWRAFGYNLRHSHIWVDYGPFWSKIFVSPIMHQVHHSADPAHYDSNFGHIFSFWDNLFGTQYIPEKREKIEFGIAQEDMDDHQTLSGMYWAPMRNIGRKLMPKRKSEPTPVMESSEHAV